MKKYIKHITLLTLVVGFSFVACEKEDVTETENQSIENSEADDQTRAGKKFTPPYEGDCGYCFQRVKVCVSPTNLESWACYEKGVGFFFHNLHLNYLCDGVYKSIKLMTITNGTPLETHCFYMDVPINTPVTLSSNSGCGHDFLCDIDVTFTSAPWEGTTWQSCTTEATYDSNGGAPLTLTDRVWFEVCSNSDCLEVDKVKVTPG